MHPFFRRLSMLLVSSFACMNCSALAQPIDWKAVPKGPADDAMTKVLEVLRDTAAGSEHFSRVDEARPARATAAVQRGVDCILRCQIVIDGGKTLGVPSTTR